MQRQINKVGHFVGLALKGLIWNNLKVINVFVGGKLLS